MRKILLHACCAPCTTYVYKILKEEGFEIKGLFFNPNIRPQEEYERRHLTMENYAMRVGLKVIYEPFSERPKKGDCLNCYVTRLRKTAEFAKNLGFDCFTTTLLISPYQKHDLLRQVGEETGKGFGIKFFYQDFRVGYRESRQIAREMKLYMQKYCGCGVDARNPSTGLGVKEKAYAKVN